MEMLLQNMNVVLNTIKTNSQKQPEELQNIYGSYQQNQGIAEKLLTQSIQIVKDLEDRELVYMFFKIYGMVLQFANKTQKSI